MKIKIRDWIILFFLTGVAFCFWYKLEYPRLAFANLSINKQQAVLEAKNYLRAKNIDINGYAEVVVFGVNGESNRYLQYTLGLKAEEDFIVQHDFDLFFWKVRFFKELQKEEYNVFISPRLAKIIGFTHIIDDIEKRPDFGQAVAKKKSEEFLQKISGIDLTDYDFHEEKTKRYEQRIEYSFSWEKKGVYIPWKLGQGGAKLIAEVTVSGDQIRKFYKGNLDLPDKFLRYVENQFILAEYLYRLFFFLFSGLLICAINIVLKRRYETVPRLVKSWYYFTAGFLIIINIIDIFNNLQSTIMFYPSSASLSSFLGLSITRDLFNISFLALGFIIPGIAGESLCSQELPKNKYSAFLHNIKSNFFNRSLSISVLLGYAICVIVLGLQAVMFYFGQKFIGVWREWYMMTDFSSAYVPLFSIFVICVTASLREEIIFRLFGISLAKKFLRNSILAVVVISFIWGMGHSMYAIFPVWFRIIEVGMIGIFYGYIFFRFGIIPLIVSHYLFNVFWGNAAYIFGSSSLYLFFGSVACLCIPLGFAVVALFLNKKEEEKHIKLALDKTQEYNLQILIVFISAKKSQGYSSNMIKNELMRHNWEHLLIDLAIEKVFGRKD